jgi:hypothetical protein
MFTLLRTLGLPETLKREFVPFAAAFLIAEFFYKFHSFALECGAFLLTWWAISFVQSTVLGGRRDR